VQAMQCPKREYSQRFVLAPTKRNPVSGRRHGCNVGLGGCNVGPGPEKYYASEAVCYGDNEKNAQMAYDSRRGES